jgi:hypothetical protein
VRGDGVRRIVYEINDRQKEREGRGLLDRREERPSYVRPLSKVVIVQRKKESYG